MSVFKSAGLRLAPGAVWIICLLFLTIFAPILAGEPAPVLTNAAAVISLPAEKASRMLKVSVTGIVTAADPVLKGRFFLQDSTSGVFVDNVNGRQLEPGDLVEVSGITYAGAFAPTVTAPKVKVIGRVSLPRAKPVSIEQLMSGAQDSQRIEISGIVRDARLEGSRITLDLVTGGYRFRAFLPSASGFKPEKLIGAQVLVRGTAAEAHNRSLRQLIAVEIYIPGATDLTVLNPDAINPFERPVISLNKLAQFRRDNSLAERVHVRGVVTLQQPGDCVFLQDGASALQIQSRQRITMAPGETVDAVGFLSFENYLPVLQDAIFRKMQVPLLPMKPQPATVQDLENGLYHANYISISGSLIELTVKSSEANSQGTTVLVLQTSNFTFTATAQNVTDQAQLADLAIGSILRVRGIALTQIDSAGALQSVQLLIRDGSDITVLKKPSWLTPNRLLIGVLILCTALFVIVSWLLVLSRKNAALNFAIRERTRAQEDLQQAHDKLEERVKERTEQLKFEITARKESEVQFKAVLSERTRLAQELHDTVEQTLTGIALQLDTASKLHYRNPENSLRHLELARSMMARSQIEVRRSVWDMRSRAQEQFDLSNALAEGARQFTSGTNIRVQVQTRGEAQPLPEVVEENLLRIGQEALANIIKHAQATCVNMDLQFEGRSVSLQVRDNGIGFDREKAVGPNEGHFGLLGMSERAKRIGGQFTLVSKSGEGTLVRVEIHLNPALEFQTPQAPNMTAFK